MSGAVPELRFPEFQDKWKQTTIGSCGTFYYGRSAPKWSVSEDAPTPCIRYGELYTKFGAKVDKIYSRTNIDPSKLKFSKGGGILVPRVGEDPRDFAKCTMLPFPGVAIGEMISVFETEEDSLFFTYYFNTMKNEFASMVAGGNPANLYYDNLKPLTIWRPSLEEQKKISSSLDLVDTKLSALRETADGLRQFKTGLMQRLFSQELRFTREDGSDFPDWDERELQEIGERSKVKNSGIKITRVLTNSATMGVIDQGDYFDKDIANAENIGGYYVIRKGEFIYNPRISVSAPVGPINRNDLADGVMSPLYTVFRINLPDTDFFAHYFASTMWHDYMKSVANYGARHDRMAISIGDFLALPLPVPHADERAKIAGALSALDAKIDAMTAQITHMEAFKKGLLQKMFV